MILPAEPFFVDRVRELAKFNALSGDLARGRRRPLALLGLRRFGKTLLLDEVRRTHPTSAIACIALDEVVSTPKDFARAFASQILGAAAVGTGRQLIRSQTDEPERRSPDSLTHGSEVIKRVLAQYEARHAEDREEMGRLFERRVENLVRQFRDQTVEG